MDLSDFFKNCPVEIIRNVLSEEELKELREICEYEKKHQQSWCSLFNRKSVHKPSNELIKQLHERFASVVSGIVGMELKPSYTYISLYGKDGYCPPHFDRIQCQYTLDIKINSDGNWPIFIKSKDYLLKDNDAVCFSGTYHFHYRERMPKDMSFCHLIFFHFVPKDFENSLD